MTQICRKNKYGYCKYGDKCRFRHENEKCEKKECNIYDCEKRHPKICNYKRDFGRCKFTTYCKYDHEKPIDILENSEKINKLEKKIENLQKISSQKDVGEVDKKIETFEQKLQILIKVIEEKDSLINDLQKKQKNVETEFRKETEVKNEEIESLEKKIDMHLKNHEILEEKVNKLEVSLKHNENKFKCKECKFTTGSEQGLKSHVTKKHKNDSCLLSCEKCDAKLQSKIDLKIHMKAHTYTDNYSGKELNGFKCETCAFIAQDGWTMQIHHGKSHGELFECGLCEFEAKSLENLELHLKTCEIYECEECEFTSKHISVIKKHNLETKKCSSSNILHVKIDRNNEEMADCTAYKHSDL